MPSNQECQRLSSSMILGVGDVSLLLAIVVSLTLHYNPCILLLLGRFKRIIFDERLKMY
jgi:hypothetical protein